MKRKIQNQSRERKLARAHTTCRGCGSDNLTIYLDLGEMPLVNRYLKSKRELSCELRFPLQIARCGVCWLSQLTFVVDPEVLFSDYAYCSSVSRTFREHCALLAREMKTRYRLGPESRIVEIASNDGCLQAAFRSEGLDVKGIEPARNLAHMARSAGFTVVNTFWGREAACSIREEGGCDLIVATNVLAHVDDLHGFLEGVRHALARDGVFVFEVPYLGTFLTRTEFDTTYHEHLSYFLLAPLWAALQASALEVIDVCEVDIHGGSLRVHAAPTGSRKISRRVRSFLTKEEDCGFLSADGYRSFAQHVHQVREELTVFLGGLKARGKKIAAYGASAKGNVLMNYCGFGPDIIRYVVDDTPGKQGLHCPGNGVKIVSREHLVSDPPDYLLLLAWNFSDELIAKVPEFSRAGGRFIVPIPALRVI